jgi:hypothetical protein
VADDLDIGVDRVFRRSEEPAFDVAWMLPVTFAPVTL